MMKINLLTGRLLSGGRRIPLTRGQSAIVDEEDFERLNAHKWCALWDPGKRSFYAVRGAPDPLRGGRVTLRMHRAIMGQPAGNGMHVDHVDGNTLDNRKQNLQVLTPVEHAHKHRNEPQRNASEGGIGVKRTPSGRFRAYANHGGERHHFGTHDTPEEARAARARFVGSLDRFACARRL